jgi:hypothetical protein
MRFVLFTLILFSYFSCSKADDLVNATIIGYDLRYCACCGGLLIKTEEGLTFQWYQQNDKFDITPKSSFPIQVKIKYHHLESSCAASDGIIEITELEKM